MGNLFKDFSKVANPLTAAAQGAGLGLAISQRIIEGCGGSMSVRSVLQEGSTFSFELPVEVLETSEEPEGFDDSSNHPQDPASLEGRRILLAEDNFINQKLLLTYLERMGVEAELAENGRIALDKFSPGKFDLVLMDVAMPEMDGLSAIRHLRQRWTPSEVPPVVILTAHVLDAIEEDLALIDVSAVLSKTVPFEELRSVLTQALRDEASTSDQFHGVEEPALEAGMPAVAAQMSREVVEELLVSFSGDELAELVASYVRQTKDSLQEMQIDHAADRRDSLSGHAHSLKGSSLLLGFNSISEIAGEIETNSTSIDAKRLEMCIANVSEHLRAIEGLLEVGI